MIVQCRRILRETNLENIMFVTRKLLAMHIDKAINIHLGIIQRVTVIMLLYEVKNTEEIIKTKKIQHR